MVESCSRVRRLDADSETNNSPIEDCTIAEKAINSKVAGTAAAVEHTLSTNVCENISNKIPPWTGDAPQK